MKFVRLFFFIDLVIHINGVSGFSKNFFLVCFSIKFGVSYQMKKKRFCQKFGKIIIIIILVTLQ